MLIVLEPELSVVDLARAAAFLDAAIRDWDDIPITRIGAKHLLGYEPSAVDAIVFFNPPRDDVSDEVEGLLEQAAETGAVVLPIALHSGDRRPPEAVGSRQSFDVTDHLRRRELDDAQIRVVGAAFAREALAVMMPTFVQNRLRLFLCHRRSDGEAPTSLIDAALSVRHEQVFRDLIEVQAGHEAQEEIDRALAGADVLVFLDTPEAGASWWIQHELATALGRAIPIVWVRIGPAEGRSPLTVEPAAAPHVEHPGEALTRADAGAIADEILSVAGRLARAHAATSQRALHDFKRWAHAHEARIEVLDARRRIYQLHHPLPPHPRAYPTRAATDVVQFFGRALRDSDTLELEKYLSAAGMGPHDRACRSFDAAILLDPTASRHRSVGEWSVAEHPSRFVSSLEQPTPTTEAERPRLLLLGAFPHGDLARDAVVPAVQAAAVTWFGLGGTIVCGGHPTFVPLLTEAARLALGDRGRDALVVFWSQFYAAPAQAQELEVHAQVVLVPAEEDKPGSLTAMRRAMVDSGGAAAVLAIGGRTDEGGVHQPGIVEEIRLARMASLPVYLLGAPGGQTALIAAQQAGASVPWAGLGNRLDPTRNAWLRETDAYEQAVRLIWETLQQTTSKS